MGKRDSSLLYWVAFRRGSIVMRLPRHFYGVEVTQWGSFLRRGVLNTLFFFSKSVAYGKAVEIDDSLQKPCRRGRTLFTLLNTSDRGGNLPGLFVRGMIYQS